VPHRTTLNPLSARALGSHGAHMAYNIIILIIPAIADKSEGRNPKK